MSLCKLLPCALRMATFRIQAFPPVSLVPPGILRTPSDKYRGIVSLLIFAIIVSEKICSYTKKLFCPLLLTSKGTLLHVLRSLLCDLEDSRPPLCKLITKRYGIHLFFPKVLMSPLPGNWQREIFIRHTYDFKNHGMAMYQEEPYPDTTEKGQQKVA